MNEKITILIPAFNREKFIKESIDSILNQTYTNFEIIVYDDGSTDRTVEIIKKIIEKDNRVKLLEGKVNKGVAVARNKLLESCNTKYACWQDSDDISNVKRLELQIKEINNNIIFTSWLWLHQNGHAWKTREKNTHDLAFATLMFPVDKSIMFKPKQKLGGEDWDWISRMRKKYKESIVNENLYYVRFHNDRIGVWKRKFILDKKITKELIHTLSYKELIDYYKSNSNE